MLYVSSHISLNPVLQRRLLDEKAGVLTQAQNIRQTSWCYHENRPPNDNAYFENLCCIVFEAGLNWNVIDKKWPLTRKAFANFSVEKIARFTEADTERLLNSDGIVHNRGKIQAVIQHAIQFREIKKTYGSFQKFLDSQDKSNNYAQLIKELSQRFRWLAPPAASLFLYTVGEDIKNPEWL